MKGIVRALLASIICFACSCLADSKSQCYENEEFDIASFKDIVDSVDQSYFSSIKKVPNIWQRPDDRKVQYAAIYRKCLLNAPNREVVKNLSDKDLHMLYDSLYKIAFYTFSNVILDEVREIIFERARRGESADNLIVDLHDGYIKAREFHKAQDLEIQYPKVTFHEIPPIDISKIGKTNLLATSENNKSLVVEPFTFPSGGHVIVVGSPQCGPSNRFFSWLLDSPKFLPDFISHATVISPVSRGLNVEVLSDFNLAHPVQMKFTYKEKEWPEIRSWNTPSFYFFNNGELVTYFSGWPPEENVEMFKQGVEMLKQAMDSIGLNID